MILACINGPWQATMLKASWLTAGYDGPARAVLLAPHSSKRFHEVTELLVRRTLLAEPVNVFDIFEAEEARLDYSLLKRRLRMRLGAETPREIWISSVLNWREVAIASVYPEIPVVLYEDGMQSCFKFAQNERPATIGQKLKIAKTWAVRIMSYNGYCRPWNVAAMVLDRQALRKRICGEYAYAPRKLLGKDKDKMVADNDLAQAILSGRDIASADGLFNSTPLKRTDRDCVFLGQCFAVLKTISEDQECGLYADAMRRLLSKGMRVLWKEHPRTAGRYFERIREQPGMEKLELFPSPPEVPVEFILARNDWVGLSVAGVTSSSMLYLSEIFNIPCFFEGKDFRPHLDSVHQRMLDAFEKHFSGRKNLF